MAAAAASFAACSPTAPSLFLTFRIMFFSRPQQLEKQKKDHEKFLAEAAKEGKSPDELLEALVADVAKLEVA